MAYIGAPPQNRVLSSDDIAQGAVTLNDINFTDQPTNMDITGTIDKHTMRLADGVTITGDVTISDDHVLSKISDDGNAITMTNDGSTRTITGSGSIEASTLAATPQYQSLTGMTGDIGSAVTGGAGLSVTGMTGELGSTVTGSPNLNLGNATFPAGTVLKHQKVLTVIGAHQSGTNSYADITGSSITYTPATGADYIVYECSFVSSADDQANPLFAFRFFIDGTITKHQDSYAPYAYPMGGQWSSIRQTHKMVYSASGWTTGKAVKMQFRRYATNNQARLHFQQYDYLTADGSNMGNTDRHTDVITTIYSVTA